MTNLVVVVVVKSKALLLKSTPDHVSRLVFLFSYLSASNPESRSSTESCLSPSNQSHYNMRQLQLLYIACKEESSTGQASWQLQSHNVIVQMAYYQLKVLFNFEYFFSHIDKNYFTVLVFYGLCYKRNRKHFFLYFHTLQKHSWKFGRT